MTRKQKAVAAPAPHDGARPVRRYANRKLYDVQSGQYVDLAGLARLVGRGSAIHVVDQPTGEDITSQVLAQILLDGLRDRTAAIPQQVLLRLVRVAYGPRPDWTGWLDRQKATTRARAEAERIASGVVARGRLTLDEAVALRHEIATSLHRVVHEAQSGLEGQLRRVLGPETTGLPRVTKTRKKKSRPARRPRAAASGKEK